SAGCDSVMTSNISIVCPNCASSAGVKVVLAIRSSATAKFPPFLKCFFIRNKHDSSCTSSHLPDTRVSFLNGRQVRPEKTPPSPRKPHAHIRLHTFSFPLGTCPGGWTWCDRPGPGWTGGVASRHPGGSQFGL